jgi:hypothetical protein
MRRRLLREPLRADREQEVLRELEFAIEVDPHFPAGRLTTKVEAVGALLLTVGDLPRRAPARGADGETSGGSSADSHHSAMLRS